MKSSNRDPIGDPRMVWWEPQRDGADGDWSDPWAPTSRGPSGPAPLRGWCDTCELWVTADGHRHDTVTFKEWDAR